MTTREAQLDEIEALKAQGKQILERAYNEGQLDALDTVYAPTLVRHHPPNPDLLSLDAFKQFIIAMRTAYPDLTFSFDEIIIEGAMWAGRWSLRGTNTGPLPGLIIPPTGKHIEITGLFFLHSRDGLVVEEWVYGDIMGLFQQLGLLPPPPPNA